jgi:glycosidase
MSLPFTPRRTLPLAILIALAGAAPALAQISDENPSPMLQWFECKWPDMERRMSDYFVAGYGSVWVPPPSRGYVPPTQVNQNSTSAGYDVFDRFNLGTPNAQTAYGTEAYFDAVVAEFHRANAQVITDVVLNHNAARQTGVQFQQEGGYPGFWMASSSPITTKQPTDSWGDFHNGTAAGYYQSENPGGARYCLLNGDLVGLIDIDQASVNSFIRQPVAANAQNIPGGTYFNIVDPNNARFYRDQALGSDTVNNPGMWFAGPLNTGQYAPPCDIPARNEPASQLVLGRFNTANPMAGDAVAENATGYLMRWTQWMIDVHHVDGFRIDAIKHMPSWFLDTYFDSVVYNRRLTPDGRHVTPYSFGECVESNGFTFDRYVRKPNGRTDGSRFIAGDAFGNRDALDLNGAGAVRNLISAGGTGSWNNVTGAHLDNQDDGFNNGSIGMMHIFSQDNGSAGDGSSNPPTPTIRQQGWYAHCYMLFRPGQSEVYHNARGIVRTGSGFYPRQGVPVALGLNTTTNALEPAITTLVQLSNEMGRGEYTPRSQDNDVLVFERRTNLGGGNYSSNCLVGVNDRYDAGYDQRTVTTSFPQGTRLLEMTGNAADPLVDPNNDLAEVLTVGAGGSVTIRVPRNLNANSAETNKGYVVYAPAIPAGSVALTNTNGSLPAETTSTPSWRRRLFAVPIISADSFQIQLTTTNGDSGAPNNDNADDNALFRVNAGFQDWNGNGTADIPYTNAVTPGYEEFVTLHQPLYNTANTQGHYAQTIDATRLEEGLNYISVVAFRHRNANEAPLFREWRQPVYIDRLDPQASIVDPGPVFGVTQLRFRARAGDRTVTRCHLILNPPPTGDPLSLANANNQCTQDDRFDYSRTLTGMTMGAPNTILLCAFEESGRGSYQYLTLYVGVSGPCGSADFDCDGDIGTDADIESFFACLAGDCPAAPCDSTPDFNGDGDIGTDADIEAFFRVLAGGTC